MGDAVGPAAPRRLREGERGGACGRLICITPWGGDSRRLISMVRGGASVVLGGPESVKTNLGGNEGCRLREN